jgi:CheY-like chemotaxis protein
MTTLCSPACAVQWRTTMDPARLHIIVVEDDPFQLETVQEVLAVAGHVVRGTERGSVALRWLEEGEPCDLLIIDLAMPEMDGPSLHRTVKQRWGQRAPRALFVSGYADLGSFSDDPDANVVPLLFKPFTLGDLFSALTRTLAGAAV